MRADISSDLHDAIKQIIRRAVLTLAAVKDPDRRFLGYQSMPQHVVHSIQEAYGYSSTFVRSFVPTAKEISQMDVVLPWLAWLRREEGDVALRRIIGWSMEVATWRLGQREGCSDKTIVSRINRSVSAIIRQFTGADIPVEHVEEPYKGTDYSLIYDKPAGPHGGPVKVLKVYVYGVGMVRGGRRLRTAQEAVA